MAREDLQDCVVGGKIDEGDGLGVNTCLLSFVKVVPIVLMSDFAILNFASDMDC